MKPKLHSLLFLLLLTAGSFIWAMPQARAQQAGGNLVFTVVVIDDLTPKPVPFTDFKITSTGGSVPDQVLRTDEKGGLTVKLAPGTYAIASVQPVTLKGRSFSWSKSFTVEDGKDCVLKLTDSDATALTPTANTAPASDFVPDPPARQTNAETIAVLPWKFLDGTNGAVSTAKEFIGVALTKATIDQVSEVKALQAWGDANGDAWNEDRRNVALPTAAQMLKVGQKLGVTWVMAGRAVWHTKSVWIALGPKTKSTCTVDAIVVDVRNGTVALDARDVKMDDTAKESTMQTLGAIFVSFYITAVSGGPKTPHEQRAGQLAISKALEPWLAQHLRSANTSISTGSK